ncbi:agmatine deiminase family protein [Streptomyces sp. CB02923]|uniref:agmatine deiminase family protein n=1 Tax=Streptomyces sp. CB02923 TaxID=1718985 RepID=UPI000A827B35|nr:agmatine deiminase family protein [Streptomyces sp. CB02923]
MRMPAEWEPHAGMYLAWPPLDSLWGASAPAVQRDIARLARTLAEYEPVALLAGPEEEARARRACGASVEIVPVPVDDLWIRDTGPVFVTRPGAPPDAARTGVDLHFNGWGGKQHHPNDGRVARNLLLHEGMPRIDAGITAEGGSFETDGEGTLLAAESSLVNANRNPGSTRARIEGEVERLLGVSRVIWVDGVRGEDITDCHIDGLARFVAPGVVALNRPWHGDGPDVWTRVYEQARGVLAEARDARGRRLETVEIAEPDPYAIGDRGPEFLASYLNYCVANGVVVLPRFGDRRADDRAAGMLRELHPGREIRQLTIDAVGEGGGGIHCATQQLPGVPSASGALDASGASNVPGGAQGAGRVR